MGLTKAAMRDVYRQRRRLLPEIRGGNWMGDHFTASHPTRRSITGCIASGGYAGAELPVR